MDKTLLRYQYATECDCDTLFKLYIDPSYGVYFRHVQPYLNMIQFRSIQTKYGSLMAIYEGRNKIGFSHISPHPNTGITEISIILLKHKQGKGYGLQIAKDLGLYLFKGSTDKLLCVTLESDERTNKILKQAGFTQDCILPESCIYNNEYQNEIRWSLKKGDTPC